MPNYTTINKSSEHFTATTWTGDSTTPKTFTTGTFKPDWLWGKNRSKTYNHQVYDTTRGAGNNKELETSSTGAEGASNPDIYGYVSAFTSTGFTATRGTDSSGDDYWNESPDNYVAWSWKANGGTTSSNSDGDITSTVQANTTAGFSIVSYTGSGTIGDTVGHGLGQKPAMVITKNRDNTSTWVVWHQGGTSTKNTALNSNEPEHDSGASGWSQGINGVPTSSVLTFTAGSAGNNNVMDSGEKYISYCFAEKTGYSKFGSYTGNGNADGPFVYLGFKPALVITKAYSGTTSTAAWSIVDTKRANLYNPQQRLFPNTNDSESDTGVFDLLSNGFKLVSSASTNNASSTNYIYMAFGQSLVGSNNVPCTAR